MSETNTQYGTQWTAEVKGLKAATQKTASNKPQIVVELEVLEGEFKGQRVQYRGLLNPENIQQTEKTIDALVALGCADFMNDPFGPNAFKGMGKIARAILAREADQNGVERLVAKFINANTLIRPESEANAEDKSSWRNTFASALKDIKAKKASTAPKSVPNASSGGEADDEPSF
jgi:hypothetical protein